MDRSIFARKISLDPFGSDIRRYLRGESLYVPEAKDCFTAVCAGDYQVGGGEVKSGTLKNLYPKGWRRII